MLETIRNAWKNTELRKKILFTLLILLIYRIGVYIPVAGVNADFIAEQVGKYSILGLMDIMSGGALGNFTLFAMGITPYINASIIMQLLTFAIPALERIAKDDENGKEKLAKYTRYLTIALALVQSVAIIIGMGSGAIYPIAGSTWLTYITIGMTLTAGMALTMWLGEQITEKGVGNGISLLIFINIVSRVPTLLGMGIEYIKLNATYAWWILPIVIAIVAIIAGVVFVDLGQRRIPVQYAKRVVGRKMYGGQSTHIPMKVNSSGVLPLIFASTFCSLPGMIAQFWPNSAFTLWYDKWLGAGTVIYAIIFALLIIFFSFFYSQMVFNPIDMSKNLQQQGGFIPGIRPGKATSDYLARINNRLVIFGAVFLAIIAMLPMIIGNVGGFGRNIAVTFGSTSLLIMVSVALETSKQLESQMLMRHYRGFLNR